MEVREGCYWAESGYRECLTANCVKYSLFCSLDPPPAVSSRLIFMDDITKMLASWLTVVLDQCEQWKRNWRVGGEKFCFSPSLQACGRVQWHAVQLTTACPPVKRLSWLLVTQGWVLPSVYLFVTRSGKNLWLLLVPRSPGIFFLLSFRSLSSVLLLASQQTYVLILCVC